MMTTKARATIEDLYNAPGKAEIIDGELVLMSPTGEGPNYAAGEVFVSLRQHARRSISRSYPNEMGNAEKRRSRAVVRGHD